MKVGVSILSSSIKAEDIVKKLDGSSADYIHVDIMDGKFVENKTWTYSEVKKIVSYSSLPLNVHLMVKDPAKYIEDYALLNTTNLIFHYEAVKDIESMISLVKEYGLKVGIAINPETSEEVLFPYLKDIDVQCYHPFFPSILNKEYSQSIIKSGIEINPYTVNEIEDFKRVIDAGVTCIITNEVEKLYNYLK